MGERYVAEDTTRGRNVMLKVLPPETLLETADATDSSARRERFKSVTALSHPNVMAIDDFGEEQGVSYLVTELLEGQTLRERLQERRLSPVEAVEYARQITDGVAAAHGRGFTHGDLRPENVFITKAGKIKVLDFGLAESIGESSSTQPGIGTVGYKSPEQVEGRSADQRCDVFSFGAILYEMLSGEAAFRGDSSSETMRAILDQDPPSLSKSTSLPQNLEKIVGKCLKKNPDERFPSARDVAVAIDALSEERTTERPPVVDDEPSPRRKWKFF
jgi:serine/threonine protein kinase